MGNKRRKRRMITEDFVGRGTRGEGAKGKNRTRVNDRQKLKRRMKASVIVNRSMWNEYLVVKRKVREQ